MKTITKILSILIVIMGVTHIGATFSPLIGGKLTSLDAGTFDAMVYMSLMCGLLLVVLGGYLRWSIGKVEAMPILKPIITITTLLLLVDGVSAAAFMPHNPFAWTIAILCVAAFVTGNVSKLSNK